MKAHTPGALPPGKKPGTHCTRGYVGPRPGPEGWGKYRLYHIRSPDGPAYIDYAMKTHKIKAHSN
jgi:hypothetical protein